MKTKGPRVYLEVEDLLREDVRVLVESYVRKALEVMNKKWEENGKLSVEIRFRDIEHWDGCSRCMVYDDKIEILIYPWDDEDKASIVHATLHEMHHYIRFNSGAEGGPIEECLAEDFANTYCDPYPPDKWWVLDTPKER